MDGMSLCLQIAGQEGAAVGRPDSDPLEISADEPLSDEESAEIADLLLFEDHAITEIGENAVRPEIVDKTAKRLKEDALRGEGTVSREDVNRSYLRLGLTIAECVEVEQLLLQHHIRVIDNEFDANSTPSTPAATTSRRYLSEADERALARTIQLANKLQNSSLGDSIVKARILAEAERARALFVSTNQLYVRKLARAKGPKKHLMEDDIYQEGMLGLLKATDLFDPDRGFRFKTYATWWIEQHIHRAIDNDDRAVRLPVHLQEKLRRIRRSQKALLLASGKPPDTKVLADAIGMDPERLGKLLWRVEATDCVEGDAEIGENATIFSLIKDEQAASQLDIVVQQELAIQLRQVLQSLTPREERVLRLRFGIDGDQSETLESIGIRFGVTRERIRQIEAKALRRLKHPSRSRKLREFLG